MTLSAFAKDTFSRLNTIDRRETRREKAAFERVKRAELRYGVRLRKIAGAVGEIVRAFDPHDGVQLSRLRRVLDDYAAAIEPWARAVASSMLSDVARRDEEAWREMTKRMSLEMRREIARAPTGRVLQRLQDEQVDLITSIPRRAAERVHTISVETLSSGKRWEEVRDDVLRTSHVTLSRANLIARTEVGRAASNLQQARAEHVGSEEYVWRTAEDVDVRPSHRRLNGKTFAWSDPPVSEESGARSHPGAIYNCRCYAEPILPERI